MLANYETVLHPVHIRESEKCFAVYAGHYIGEREIDTPDHKYTTSALWVNGEYDLVWLSQLFFFQPAYDISKLRIAALWLRNGGLLKRHAIGKDEDFQIHVLGDGPKEFRIEPRLPSDGRDLIFTAEVKQKENLPCGHILETAGNAIIAGFELEVLCSLPIKYRSKK